MKLLIKIIRTPLFWTDDKQKALTSRWFWSEDYRGEYPRFGLSLLGMLNGLFPKGKKLVVVVRSGKGVRLGFLKNH